MKRKIVIAEEYKGVRDVLNRVLTDMGFDTEVYDNGLDALKSYENGNPDMLILDGKMPDLTGYDITKNIREKDTETPIIVVSGGPTDGGLTEENIDFIKSQPNTKYITKPFGLEELRETVYEFLKKRNK